MLAKTTVAMLAVALVQAPARVATYALILRRLRRACPEMFDGHLAATVVNACLAEYDPDRPLTQ